MAVETHHLHLFQSQLVRNSEAISAAVEHQQSGVYNTQMGLVAPTSGNGFFVPFYNSAPTATVTAAADSGLTFNNQSSATIPRKRSRNPDRMSSFLGEDISSHIQQQMSEVDRLIVHHVEKVRAELNERRRRFCTAAVAAVEERVSKRLRVKEEEIERIGKLNWALEERVRSLCVENQIWRDLAQTNEAAANVLRANLEQVLAAQVRVKAEEERQGEAAEDAESCCCGDNQEDEEERRGTAAAEDLRKRVCRHCGEREPSVLLLPCRHLCLCAACGPAVDACPICKCGKNGSVVVNIV